MKFYIDKLEIAAPECGVVNLNPLLNEAVEKSSIRNGFIIVQSLHSTAGIATQEDEEGILKYDLPRLLDRLVPRDEYYAHDDTEKRQPRVGPEERKNGHAHLKRFLVGHNSEIFIVYDYRILFGTWVSGLLLDFDPIGRKSREIAIAVMGE